jgi:hypothetical protein
MDAKLCDFCERRIDPNTDNVVRDGKGEFKVSTSNNYTTVTVKLDFTSENADLGGGGGKKKPDICAVCISALLAKRDPKAAPVREMR